ncbi:hypothetical protein [Trichormus azollae]|nr:hypothetical protein [Trichormus azollae]
MGRLGMAAAGGGKCYEGKRYRLWQKGEILTITAKDNRGDILSLENGVIGGYLSSADVEGFQIFEQTLEQQLEEAKRKKYQTS